MMHAPFLVTFFMRQCPHEVSRKNLTEILDKTMPLQHTEYAYFKGSEVAG
jgi:hypothetical protein